MRAFLLASASALVCASGCTDWEALSVDYDGPGVCPVYVVTGDTHSCVRKSNGALRCWGDNRFGQLGTGDANPRAVPTRSAQENVAKIYVPMGTGDITANAAASTCAITTDDGVVCWGDNRTQIVRGEAQTLLLPTLVPDAPDAPSEAALGAGFLCLLDGDGTVSCGGKNAVGQAGHPPEPVVPISRVAGISADKLVAGANHTCVRTPDASMWCWGGNDFGQLGLGDTTSRSVPTEIVPLHGRVAHVAAGSNHTCAQTPEGALLCWGDNRFGQLGTGSTTPSLVPVAVMTDASAATKVFTGGAHTCVIRSDGTFACWGDNRSGQLGLGDSDPRSVPTPVTALGNGVASASTGGAHTCVVKSDGSVWCWGNNQFAQLGVPVGREALMPAQVSPPCQ